MSTDPVSKMRMHLDLPSDRSAAATEESLSSFVCDLDSADYAMQVRAVREVHLVLGAAARLTDSKVIWEKLLPRLRPFVVAPLVPEFKSIEFAWESAAEHACEADSAGRAVGHKLQQVLSEAAASGAASGGSEADHSLKDVNGRHRGDSASPVDASTEEELRLVNCFSESTLEELLQVQLNSVGILVNVAASGPDGVRCLVEHGFVPVLVSMAVWPRPDMIVTALWALGNIAGDSSFARDVLLRTDLLPLLHLLVTRSTEEARRGQLEATNSTNLPPSLFPVSIRTRCSAAEHGVSSRVYDRVVAMLRVPVPLSRLTTMVRLATWTVSNLCDHVPASSIPRKAVFATLVRSLQVPDDEVRCHACWALSRLSDVSSESAEAVLRSDAMRPLVRILDGSHVCLIKPALRTVGNVVCADEDASLTDRLLALNVINPLASLVTHERRDVQKEACWTLSNIAAGSPVQIQAVLQSGCLPSLLALAESPDTESSIRTESCWVMLNAATCGTDGHVFRVVESGCVRVIGKLLSEPSMATIAKEAIGRILRACHRAASPDKDTKGKAAAAKAAPPLRVQDCSPRVAHGVAMVELCRRGLLESRSRVAGDDGNVRKARKLWDAYFEQCTLCQTPLPRGTALTRWCRECKTCMCNDCDCSRFHLEHQQQLWKELEMEDEEERRKQQSRRNRRAKKKAKSRRKARLRKEESAEGSAATSEPSFPQQEDSPARESRANEEKEETRSVSASTDQGATPVRERRQRSERDREESLGSDGDRKEEQKMLEAQPSSQPWQSVSRNRKSKPTVPQPAADSDDEDDEDYRDDAVAGFSYHQRMPRRARPRRSLIPATTPQGAFATQQSWSAVVRSSRTPSPAPSLSRAVPSSVAFPSLTEVVATNTTESARRPSKTPSVAASASRATASTPRANPSHARTEEVPEEQEETKEGRLPDERKEVSPWAHTSPDWTQAADSSLGLDWSPLAGPADLLDGSALFSPQPAAAPATAFAVPWWGDDDLPAVSQGDGVTSSLPWSAGALASFFLDGSLESAESLQVAAVAEPPLCVEGNESGAHVLR